MHAFLQTHAPDITGQLGCFDRLIFKGYLPLVRPEVLGSFLCAHGVLLKDFKHFVLQQSERLRVHAQGLAQQAGPSCTRKAACAKKRTPAGSLRATD